MKPFPVLSFRFWISLGLGIWGLGFTAAAAVSVTDADGVVRRLDEPGRVTVVIYSNPALQEWTRKAGASLDRFQGIPEFRSVVVVDLRKSMADWAPGYTTRRMQRDLDKEAGRITPSYRSNGNNGNPRPDVSAVPDFKGEACKAVGWTEPANLKRVVVFGPEGKIVYRSDDETDFSGLKQATAKALGEKP